MIAHGSIAARILAAALACTAIGLVAAGAAACPFCPAVRPTLAQQREAADVVLFAEVVLSATGDEQLKVHRTIRQSDRIPQGKTLPFPRDLSAKPGSLLLLFGSLAQADDAATSDADAVAIDWETQVVDETGYGYFARAPGLREPASARLRYFARYLEHPNTVIAADAMMEFAHASFSDVARAADALPLDSARRWLADDQVPQERKGFYGLILGLAKEPADVAANRAVLQREIDQPGDDLRAGFDGLLAGLLLLEGEDGLKLIEERYLKPADSRDGDVRHALAALRFYAEYGEAIPLARLSAAVRHLLARPEFAAAAIVELSRWQDAEALGEVVRLYDAPDYPQPGTRRAVVGYLLASHTKAAEAELARLRRLYPDEVAEAERHLSLFGAGR